MAASVDRVWALHDFEAENPDEVSFKAGECILVVDKDDEYGDGWWQGTNQRGEQGLFPFSYTTTDKNLAMSAQTDGTSQDALDTTQAVGSTKPGVMHSTMADIDHALTELQGDQNGTARSADLADTSRASLTSQQTLPDDQSESMVETDDFAGRSLAARAALAANAQKDVASANQREKMEGEHRRAEARREFEAEELRQRDLLLAKEKERQAKVAAGDYSEDEPKPKVAPIAGVDMSDESDSEGSVGDLDDFQVQTHSPLFGNLASTPKNGVASRELNGSTQNKSLHDIVEDNVAAPPITNVVPEPPQLSTADPPEALPTSSPLANAASLSDGTSASAETAPLIQHHAAPISNTTEVSNQTPLLAGAGAIAVGTGAAGAAFASHSASTEPAVYPTSTPTDPSHNIAPSITASTDDGTMAKAPSIAGDTATAGHGNMNGTDLSRSIGSPTPDPAASVSVSDPSEWSVEQVVEWARAKGWDESAVVGKFQEHEISGDVLLEMDINILKEIEITAFGKRFQVANAIKELRKQVPGLAPVTSPDVAQAGPTTDAFGSPALGSPALIGPMGGFPMSVNNSSQHSGPQSVREGSNADGRSLNNRIPEHSIDQSATSRPTSFGGTFSSGTGPNSFAGQQGFGGPAGVAAWQAQQQGSRFISDGHARASGDAPMSPASPLGGRNLVNRYSTKSTDDRLGALPSSPRKRESSGSGTAAVKDTNRSSFFGLGSRNRKQPPQSAGSVSSNGWEDEKSTVSNNSKGTLSRLGFARNSRNISAQSSQSTIKEQISLPTSSPHFDSNGDTARRSRINSNSGTRGSPVVPSGMASQARPTSIGSAGPDAAAATAATAGAGAGAGATGGVSSTADGPVMSRIQPVDLEGWIKKKGERYNSWKPRYLALKGPDLVILRDPRAEKIKGYINMKGYKVIADENTNPGKYGFKLLHETEKPHYFSSEDPILVREWMKALMKSTIGRDHSFPVISSYNNATISLKEAQRMNPPPRPPSPTTRARTQRAKIRPNPEQLTARDAAILMNLTSGQQTKTDDVA